MAVRTATAEWKGDFEGGSGSFSGESGEIAGAYSASSRFEEGGGTNPEELIAPPTRAASRWRWRWSGARAATRPSPCETEARVQILKEGEGFAIKKIELDHGRRASRDRRRGFQQAAEAAKQGCPVSWRSPRSRGQRSTRRLESS